MDPYPHSGYDHNHNLFPTNSTSNGTPFRLDEGFSEDASISDEAGRNTFNATAARFQEWVMAQNEDSRAEIAYEVLRTLRTSNIAAVVDKLTPLLHIDPIEKLPPEVTSEIFSYLDAVSLLTASLASQAWRARILDSKLWQALYFKQGWGANTREMAAFEASRSHPPRNESKKSRGQLRHSDTSEGPQHKRRATADWLEARNKGKAADVTSWREQHEAIEADVESFHEIRDHEMQDVIHASRNSPPRAQKRHSQDSGDEMDFRLHNSYPGSSSSESGENSTARLAPKLLTSDAGGVPHVDWSYLYKQRQRLEENWTKGLYTNFELPHQDHAYEAHTECVYTIQFYGKWLVSGSRDKTLRVWDLETRRLRGKPLTGHSQSVLCLQFDPTEEEDVIVSGSSDSSIIVWKFSSGQKLLEIPHAHEESVLNLRFDYRYLVTCSKDKKIKIWNRHQLIPGSADYPKVIRTNSARTPAYIIDVAGINPSLLEARLASGAIKPLKPYTHLMTLEGHGAAVNAIQIHGDLIVSASGDRLIKVWNVRDGKLVRTLPGHQKGIACVQFDSRRIVSGSSDNTVRIYDPMTGAEVAELKGHTNLVRTVQAGFGDLPTGEEDDATLARAAEQKYLEDIANGSIVEERRQRRNRQGEEGSSRLAFGSRLPPGGGGSKWGKIVSGSYDESIIIWRKNAEGDWTIGRTLRQDTSRARHEEQPAARTSSVIPAAPALPSATAIPAPTNLGPPGVASAALNGSAGTSVMTASQLVHHAMGTSMASLGAGITNVAGLARNLNTPISPWTTTTTTSTLTGSSSGPAPQRPHQHLTNNVSAAMAQALQQQHDQAQKHLGPPLQPGQSTFHQQTTSSSLQAQPSQSVASSSTLPTMTHNNNPPQPAAATTQQPPPLTLGQARQNHHQHFHQNNSQQQSVSRVFKLQFDARRIVCCSQDSRIIGWDFANGDPEIMEACPFFLGP